MSHLKRKKMAQKITLFKTAILTMITIAGLMVTARAQNILYEENMGVPTANTLIQNYTGWQNSDVTYLGNGTCDVRTSSASTGYGGASGGGNVMINDTAKWFQISGINTQTSHPTVNLYCGLRKTSAEDGSNFLVEYSTDSIVWVQLPMAEPLPTGTGTGGWHRVCFPNLPSHPHLHLRFSNRSKADYRLDDICITEGAEIVLETVATPTFMPASGTYYSPIQFSMDCATQGASIYYTTDGSTPSSESALYTGEITLMSSCEINAFATKEGMYNSNIMHATYVISDTTSLVELPFDISHNSDSEKEEVRNMPGFRSNKLGASYADGSAKFESKNAKEAYLTAHLDSAPDKLSFDIKGVKGGSPSSYSGITFIVSESVDGLQWSTVATLNENDISTEGYVHQGDYTLSPETRYIRWLLAAATSGNTQLNNIVITKLENTDDNGDDSGINNPDDGTTPNPYPNPAHQSVQWNLCDEGLSVSLYDLSGREIRRWEEVHLGDRLELDNITPGCYMLKGQTPIGTVTKKLIVKP